MVLTERKHRKVSYLSSGVQVHKHFYVTDQVERGLVSIEYCPTDQMVADYGTKALQGKPFGNHRSFIMNLPQVDADEKAVCHMMRARDQLPWEVESDSNDSEEEDVYDTGPSAVDDLRWIDDPILRTGEYLLESGTPILLRPTAPYHYGDALREKIIHKVLTPQMLELWFRNREDGGAFLSARQAYRRGVPIRNILYGNCRQCLRAGGLMQRCHMNK